ncbi:MULTISPECIES: formylglycine-generating enzyme family protein [Pseudomonas]|uniref:Formylglycine-generating enzyme family protein n=1 Tax=Pseudomonas mosselii TaxID=78327 RepID=A0A5R8ZBB0_9PSED|nr:formylglycine-generating enzyme family protein [Pseudomonas mosselii]TLP63020.1 formylglycine-generating enzyme family protein [Pseudomonas mosselii]
MKRWLVSSFILAGVLWAVAALWPRPVPTLGSRTACEAYDGLPNGWGSDPLAGMVRVSGGRFTPGNEAGYPDERPLGAVDVGNFWIDRSEVTRAQFGAFVAATGYVTEAERAGVGAVFRPSQEGAQDTTPLNWWKLVKGADWRHPDGPDAPPAALDGRPVTLVTLADAQAYANWRGNQLPSEAEWEYAARAGSASQRLGELPLDAHGKPAANYWQGIFPLMDMGEDGYTGLAPVGCFAPNAFGLFDMIGNVWEWTTDTQWGPLMSHANGDPGQLRAITGRSASRIIKGGSYLCADNYCARYRTAARERQEADLATSHVGFRTIRPIVP